jgi:hypothetical protein
MFESWREWRLQGRELRERCREGQSVTSRLAGWRACSTAGQVRELQHRENTAGEGQGLTSVAQPPDSRV